MRATGKFLCFTSMAIVLVWIIAMAAPGLLVASVAGCSVDGKGDPMYCGWADTPVQILNSFAWVAAATSFFVAAPCLLVGLLLGS